MDTKESEPFLNPMDYDGGWAPAVVIHAFQPLAFDPNQVTALYFGIPFVGACYAFFYLK